MVVEKKRILFIDDEELILETYKWFAEINNYEGIYALSGEEALKVVSGCEKAIDLIVSDVVMGKFSGTEFYAELKNEGYQIPIIYVTGYANLFHEMQDIGTVTVLNKPVRFTELKVIIANYLSYSPSDDDLLKTP